VNKWVDMRNKRYENMVEDNLFIKWAINLRKKVWGNDDNDYLDYNTVASALGGEKYFVYLQIWRFLSLIVMVIGGSLYMFIFLKMSPCFIQFFPILLTTLAFFFLFTGAGKQMVY